MTALAKKRIARVKTADTIELPATAGTYYQGGLVCWDTSTGLVTKGSASTTLACIGVVEDGDIGTTIGAVTVASGGTLVVRLFRELRARWMVNATAGDAVVAANLGSLVYVLDDQTVQNNSASSTLSVAGRAWALDTNKGVLVEFRSAP